MLTHYHAVERVDEPLWVNYFELLYSEGDALLRCIPHQSISLGPGVHSLLLNFGPVRLWCPDSLNRAASVQRYDPQQRRRGATCKQ